MDEHLFSFIFNHLGVHQHFRVIHVPYFCSKSFNIHLLTLIHVLLIFVFCQLIFNRLRIEMSFFSKEYDVPAVKFMRKKISVDK
jgi:hypothetical protein